MKGNLTVDKKISDVGVKYIVNEKNYYNDLKKKQPNTTH